MGEIIWVEVLSRHRNVVARFRCTGPQVRIGRSYANDVVIDDPHVAPQHVLVERDDNGALIAEDLGTANGLFADRDTHKLKRIVLDGERLIRIGHTDLRIRDANYAVTPERVSGSEARTWPTVLALGVAILGIQVVLLWLSETSEPKLSRYLLPLLGLSLFALGWTAAWATLSRIFSGQARFDRNLVIALAGILVFSLYGQVTEFAAFALSWRALAAYQYIGLWSLLAAVCFFHLREIGPSRLRIKGGVVVALLSIAIAMQTLTRFETCSGYDQQTYVRRLMPPAVRLTPVHNENTFFADIEQLKSRLDRDRTEDLPSGVIFPGFYSDD